MCVCVRAHACLNFFFLIYIYIYILRHKHTQKYVCHTHTHTHTHAYVYMNICLCLHVHVRIVLLLNAFFFCSSLLRNFCCALGVLCINHQIFFFLFFLTVIYETCLIQWRLKYCLYVRPAEMFIHHNSINFSFSFFFFFFFLHFCFYSVEGNFRWIRSVFSSSNDDILSQRNWISFNSSTK